MKRVANTALPCSSSTVTNNELHTKAMLISYFNSKCHINKLKSNRTCLIGHTGFISHEKLRLGSDCD